MVRTYTVGNLTFEWHGGTYIDIYRDGEITDVNINVKDSGTGELLIENARRGFVRRCNRWIRESV